MLQLEWNGNRTNVCDLHQRRMDGHMGQAIRTTKLPIDLGERTQGGANSGKRTHLVATVALLDKARSFYLGFFLAHAEKFCERVAFFSEHHQQMRERGISAHELLTWAESHTVSTKEHPDPAPGWNFSERFPGMPVLYRRSVIKDVIGKVKAYLSNCSTWQRTGKKKGKPGVPGRAITPRSMRAHGPLHSTSSTCARALCGSRSTRVRVGGGRTIP